MSFPVSTLRTIELAMASTLPGSFCMACWRAASASGKRPRWISAMAWPTIDFVADEEGP